MLVTAFSTVLLGAAASYGQSLPSIPSNVGGLTFSPSCQQSIVSVLTNGSFASCFKTADLLPLLGAGNNSIIPYLDKFMTDLCGPADVCTNTTLSAASQTIIQGCGADLKNESLPDTVVTTAFSLFPVVREVLCLKTSDPYTNASYGGFLGAPPIPVTAPVYNSTNGTFCVTSVLTQLSAYFGHNLTIPWIAGAVTGANSTADKLVTSIQTNALCNECVFGAADVVAAAAPALATTPISAIVAKVGPVLLGNSSSSLVAGLAAKIPANLTIESFLNGTCAYENYSLTTNGTLPQNITQSAQNMTAMAGNSTMSMKRWM